MDSEGFVADLTSGVAEVDPPSTPTALPARQGFVFRLGRWLRAYQAYLLGMFSIAVFLLLWDILTVDHVSLYVRFFNLPTPREVFEGALAAFSTTTFATDILVSCQRILIGFVIATLMAVPLGMLMGRFQLIRDAVFPVTELLRPVPAIAWVPMSIMLWPTTEESVVFITFLGSFFPILINTLHGMTSVDPVLVRAGRCLGTSEWSMFVEIYLPGAMPDIFTGLTVGMGVAWVSLIAAEMISGQFGIGYFTWEAYSLIQYPDIALGMIAIGILGLAFSTGIALLGRLVMPWRTHH